MFKKIDPKMNLPKMEEEILGFWEKEKIFEKSVEKDSPKGDFVFYEGPPTANGKPGLHHVLARSFKDIIPRYKTMKGYRVRRKAGWDTHGLPVELQVEKALGLRSKQEIEDIVPDDERASVIEFNKKCKESVWEYRDVWEKLTRRMGYWVDMEHPYVTYENDYIESVWWQLAQVAKLKNEKGESFLYKGHKVVPYCYRCGTALSSHEVAQGYKEVKDNSVYVKFKAVAGQKIGDFITDDNTYFLAWTTTPWTLPGNAALAVNENLNYVRIDFNVDHVVGDLGEGYKKGEKCIAVEGMFTTSTEDKVDIFKGKDLLGLEYKPLFDAVSEEEKGKSFRVVAGDFVTTDSGTGIVHIAPAFGEDDANVARENDLPTLLTVETDGTMKRGLNLPGEGVPVKKLNDKNRYAVDDFVIEDLKKRELLFREEAYTHEYPFCWRCDTPLIYYAKPSWFIRMSELREELVKNNEAINWVPEHIKDGRFGEWLRGVKDWAISRERYWGTPLPIWECVGTKAVPSTALRTGEQGCGRRKIIESLRELEDLSEKKLEDAHKPYIDEVEFPCECGGMMWRVPEVLDVWFDSGAMPLAQLGYPFSATKENKEAIESGKLFPADYICEAIDQTRGWFYTLHAVANLLSKAGVVKEGRAYRNVICLEFILDAKGKKMSKSKGNVIDPFEMFDQFGADQLRWYLFSINQPWISKHFDVKGMRDVQNRVFRMLWNSYVFFVTYAEIDKWEPKVGAMVSSNLLDRWILSELQTLVKDVDGRLETYDVYGSTAAIESFIDHLSNWYIRRSRKRFWKNENDRDKEQAYQTLYDVLVTLSKLMAPFMPFLAEEMYRNLANEPSVHLASFPAVNEGLIDEKLNEDMKLLREVVTLGLQFRAENGIKVRQPLNKVLLPQKYSSLLERVSDESTQEWENILCEELNVKGAAFGDYEKVQLDTRMTPELKLEGETREVIRAIQEGRKKAGFNVEDRIVLGYSGKEKVFEMFGEMIAKEVLATDMKHEMLADAEYSEEVSIEGETFTFWLKRV